MLNMIKRLDKKGISAWGVIIGIILMVSVAVVAFYWFYDTGSDIFDKKDVFQDGLTAAAFTCEISAKAGDKTGYCVEEKEIEVGGRKGFFNCPYIKDELLADIPSGDDIVCNEKINDSEKWANYHCGKLKSADNKVAYGDAWVNGFTCVNVLGEWGAVACEGVDGRQVCSAISQCLENNRVSGDFSDVNDGEVCCKSSCVTNVVIE